MRRRVDRERIENFMRSLGRAGRSETRLYFTGGATAVLSGWRTSTLDLDISLEPESDDLLRAVPSLKERLELNVELASPAHFIPELPGWRERSRFVAREGNVSFYHYDLYSQALSKIERGHDQDVADVREMLARGLIDGQELLHWFERIEPELYRYPAIDPPSFRRALEELLTPAAPAPSPPAPPPRSPRRGR